MAEHVAVIAKVLLYYPHDGKNSTQRDGRFPIGSRIQMLSEHVDAYGSNGMIALAGAEDKPEESGHGDSEVLKSLWEMEMSPREYLEKFAEGPHAVLALSILEAEQEAAESTSSTA